MTSNMKNEQHVMREKHFSDLFNVFVDDLTNTGLKSLNTYDAYSWFKKVLEYNVPHGKKNRGLTVLHSYEFLVGENKVSEDDIRIASLLGWCIELLQAFFLVADDIMDSSLIRRGQPCWYKKDEVGLTAINDSFFLESSLYILLKKYIRDKPYYADILDLFHEITHKTIIGQNLDLLTSSPGIINLDAFTQSRYETIVKYKTSYYTFFLPVACALYMIGMNDKNIIEKSEEILLKMGELFQIQDDYLDCYGDPEITGKIGTDIEDNKCSWLVVQAIKLVDNGQMDILKESYGKRESTHIKNIIKLYDQLKLKEVFQTYEETSFKEINSIINRISDSRLPKELFTSYVNKIYKRQK